MPHLIIVDDDPFTLTTLTATFAALGVSSIVAVRSAAEAIDSAASASSSSIAAVVDLDLGEGPTGIDLAHRLRQINPAIGIVILSTYAEPRLMGTRQQAIPSRAKYLVKQSIDNPQLLLDAVLQSITNGATVTASSPLAKLRDNQVEVMRLVASGLTNAQIAEQLRMKESAVEKAVARLIKQLGITSSREYNQRVLIAQEYHRLARGHRDTD